MLFYCFLSFRDVFECGIALYAQAYRGIVTVGCGDKGLI